MAQNITKEIAVADSPVVGLDWANKSDEDRVSCVLSALKLQKDFENFEVLEAGKNGQVILRTEVNIPANIRGPLLLDLEMSLKNSIEKSITIWLEPVGDKSKLRMLRGIEIKSENRAIVNLLEPENSVSPGQACVFYTKDPYGTRLLGGGWIQSTN